MKISTNWRDETYFEVDDGKFRLLGFGHIESDGDNDRVMVLRIHNPEVISAFIQGRVRTVESNDNDNVR